MRRRTWVALAVAFAMLVAMPAQAGTRAKSSSKKKPIPGILLAEVGPYGLDDQAGHKIWYCDPSVGGSMRTQYLDGPSREVVFGTGWAVMEQVQATRFRDLVNGRLTFEWDQDPTAGEDWVALLHVEMVAGRWTVVDILGDPDLPSLTHGDLPFASGDMWPDGGDDVGEYAWSEPYATQSQGGYDIWRTDWEFEVTLYADYHYRFSDVFFEITAGTNADRTGDAPGPIIQYDACDFVPTSAAPPAP